MRLETSGNYTALPEEIAEYHKSIMVLRGA